MPVSFVDYSQLKYVWRPLTGSRSSLSLGKTDVLDVKAHFAGAKQIIYTYSYKNCTFFYLADMTFFLHKSVASVAGGSQTICWAGNL